MISKEAKIPSKGSRESITWALQSLGSKGNLLRINGDSRPATFETRSIARRFAQIASNENKPCRVVKVRMRVEWEVVDA